MTTPDDTNDMPDGAAASVLPFTVGGGTPDGTPGGTPGAGPSLSEGMAAPTFTPDGAVLDDPAAPAAPPKRRIRTRTWVLGSIAVVLTLALTMAALWRMPYYRFSPGTLYPTVPLVTVDDPSVEVFRDQGGSIDFTTVSSKKVSFLEYQLARFDPAVELIPAELIDGDKPPEETRQLNLEMMADSKQIAEVVALDKLGYKVQISGTGALVRAVGKDTPAASVLKANDTITKIDDKPVQIADEAVAALGEHKPGDTVVLTVEPPPDGGPTRTESVTLAARESDATKPLLGVDLGTRATTFKLPFPINVDTKDIGGPSAGLGITLGIIDLLTPGSLTGGQHVAVTGTISLDGSVGPIGGVQQKTFLAERNGVQLFLVPKDELGEAQKYAGTMKVVGVSNLDEALKAIQENGGSTDSVDQVAAGHTGTTAH